MLSMVAQSREAATHCREPRTCPRPKGEWWVPQARMSRHLGSSGGVMSLYPDIQARPLSGDEDEQDKVGASLPRRESLSQPCQRQRQRLSALTILCICNSRVCISEPHPTPGPVRLQLHRGAASASLSLQLPPRLVALCLTHRHEQSCVASLGQTGH